MQKIDLKNGLAVYLDPKNFGISAAYLYINSGSGHDKIPQTAHLLEHLQANNAKVYGESGKLNYSHCNAKTERKRTSYYFRNILPEDLELAVKNLSLAFSQPNKLILEREKEAVRHELSPYDSELNEFAERASDLLFPVFRKKIPSTKKSLSLLNEIKYETANEFWDEHYDPANAFFYICGDINDADKYLNFLGNLPTRNHKSKPLEKEDEVELKQRIELKEKIRPDNIATMQITYQSPCFPHQLSFKDDVAIWILTKYLSSTFGILYKKLRDEHNLCYNLSVSSDREIGKLMALGFSTSTQPGLIEKVENEWLKSLEHITKNSISQEHLDTFRNIEKIKTIKQKVGYDNVDDLELKLDMGISIEEVLQTLNQLTTDDIRKASKIFVERPYLISIALPK